MIHLVTHCYSVRLNHYAEFLGYQLSSLILHPPEVKTVISVCCSPTDTNTFGVFSAYSGKAAAVGVTLQCHGMLDHHLFRRCIGRNQVAKQTEADVVWFTDCDHVFGPGCIDQAYEAFQRELQQDAGLLMIYPKEILIHETHAIGDLLADSVKVRGRFQVVGIESRDFVPKSYNRAIGGVQIVRGDYCRHYGYLDGNTKWQQPRYDGKPFGDFKDDVVFRKELATRGTTKRVHLPQLYRLRHSVTTYQ